MDGLLRWALGGALLASLALVPGAVFWAVLVRRRSRTVGRGDAARSATIDTAIIGSILFMLVITLRPGFGLDPGSEQWNLVPFRDLARSVSGPRWAVGIAVANLVGNALLFFPLGFCLALRFPTIRVVSLVFVVAALSVAVEIGQAVTATGRLSDVTDVIMNTAGGLVGLALTRALQRRRDVRHVATRPLPPQSPHG